MYGGNKLAAIEHAPKLLAGALANVELARGLATHGLFEFFFEVVEGFRRDALLGDGDGGFALHHGANLLALSLRYASEDILHCLAFQYLGAGLPVSGLHI